MDGLVGNLQDPGWFVLSNTEGSFFQQLHPAMLVEDVCESQFWSFANLRKILCQAHGKPPHEFHGFVSSMEPAALASLCHTPKLMEGWW